MKRIKIGIMTSQTVMGLGFMAARATPLAQALSWERMMSYFTFRFVLDEFTIP